jgi:uncharacterized membrane protein YkoI
MKNLSKALALALLLTPVAAQADQWCHGDNQHIWTYASGQMPITFSCSYVGTPSITQAETYANNKCQIAWDNFASNYTDNGFVAILYYTEIGNTNVCRWKYRCRACMDGYPPYIPGPRPVLGPAEAGHAAVSLAKGVVLSVELHDADKEDPFYQVDVLTESEQVQVEVDATTGRAEIVKQDGNQLGIRP